MWNLIYSQSCFSNITAHDACTERKIFYRLISGAGAATLYWFPQFLWSPASCHPTLFSHHSLGGPSGQVSMIVASAWPGMHASISAHIAKDYLLDEAANEWGPNLALFRARLGNEGVRERVENLYFTYLFVLRATLKAAPLLADAAYDTGSPDQDARTAQLVRQLVRTGFCPCLCMWPRHWVSQGAWGMPCICNGQGELPCGAWESDATAHCT